MKDSNEELYRRSIEAKSEALLKIIGQKILEKREEEINQNETESETFVIPKKTHEAIAQMIKKEKKAALIKNRKNKLKKFAKVCAALFIVLGISGMILVNNVEAFKFRFDNFWVEVKTEYLGLTPKDENSEDNIDEDVKIKGIWYPKYLPEGFQFSSIEYLGDIKELLFIGTDGQTISISETKADGMKIYIDNEAEENGRVEINKKYDAYWSKNDGKTVFVWLQDDNIIEISAKLELNEIIKIAESMVFEK
ncbi:DUF4367 domain-containing protein [Anaerovorax odorimutans]|uniref:DUF4367 domain-containing protein n=1 Tax=Anaerovorax odorimutans TaxID=109327 RepID=UPI00041C99DE|nr:DUF4367 domain-containing protein [Anaerovorax odorimutans]